MNKRRKNIAVGTLIAVLFIIAVVAGFGLNLVRQVLSGSGGKVSWARVFGGVKEAVFDPRAGFPGQNKINIVCMGIDDSWTTKDMVYTSDSRTDTLFLLTLDLDNQTASMLSIPRDSYTHIAGTNYSDKINSAYSTGGPQRTLATVADLTGVSTPYYLVLNINATKDMVNALGGVDLDVEHAMRYDDNWGHLHINLKPGFQHLNGSQAVGFARYRHPNPGMPPTPEDGDIRRTYRQHVLLKAMVAKAKTFSNLTKINQLIDVAMSEIRTNLTRQQLFDLARLYRNIQPDSIRTATLPGKSFIAPGGAWDYQLDPATTKAYVQWAVDDNTVPLDHLTTIIVQNGTTSPGLAENVVKRLQAEGYTSVYNGGNTPAMNGQLASYHGPAVSQQTTIVDTGVTDPQVSDVLAKDLGVNALVDRKKIPPNNLGWRPPPTITIALGQDYANIVKDGAPPVTMPATAAN
jgi:LCP family protein required for cell wall assembly